MRLKVPPKKKKAEVMIFCPKYTTRCTCLESKHAKMYQAGQAENLAQNIAIRYHSASMSKYIVNSDKIYLIGKNTSRSSMGLT